MKEELLVNFLRDARACYMNDLKPHIGLFPQLKRYLDSSDNQAFINERLRSVAVLDLKSKRMTIFGEGEQAFDVSGELAKVIQLKINAFEKEEAEIKKVANRVVRDVKLYLETTLNLTDMESALSDDLQMILKENLDLSEECCVGSDSDIAIFRELFNRKSLAGWKCYKETEVNRFKTVITSEYLLRNPDYPFEIVITYYYDISEWSTYSELGGVGYRIIK